MERYRIETKEEYSGHCDCTILDFQERTTCYGTGFTKQQVIDDARDSVYGYPGSSDHIPYAIQADWAKWLGLVLLIASAYLIFYCLYIFSIG